MIGLRIVTRIGQDRLEPQVRPGGLQGQAGAQVGGIGQMSDQAALVGLEEGFEDPTGEQLRLGELRGAVRVRVGPQGPGREGQGLAGDAQGRFAELAHPKLEAPNPAQDSWFSTEPV
jgi:hypothetical protein